MDQKFIALLLVASFTAGYLIHGCLLKSNNYTEIVAKDDLCYSESFRNYLEAQIQEYEEQKKGRYFLDYTLTDFIGVFGTSVPKEKELPISELVYKVLQIKVEKITKRENLSLTEAVIGLFCFYIVSEM